MKRVQQTARTDWPSLVEAQGLTYHLHETDKGTRPYWNENAAYEFRQSEIELAEYSIKELHSLLIATAEEVVKRDWWGRLGIPAEAVPFIEASWERDDFSLYGRFDLAWMPGGAPQLLEYNADTPTSLIEAAVAQWFWMKDTHPEADQFNSIHERLIDAWKRFAALHPERKLIDFCSLSSNPEDEQTVSYLLDTCLSAGLSTRYSPIEKLGYDAFRHAFLPAEAAEGEAETLTTCFKLYPWEWMFHESFGQHLQQAEQLRWLEPPWKALLSNKGILAVAWELHPGHPNLLPCFFEAEKAGRSYVKKPKLSREGANVSIFEDGRVVQSSGGDYGEEGFVYQQKADLPCFDGNHAVFGGWVIDHEPAGLGVRESDSIITDNLSRFVPHYFLPA